MLGNFTCAHLFGCKRIRRPAPPNYPLRYPKCNLIETIRPSTEVHWGVGRDFVVFCMCRRYIQIRASSVVLLVPVSGTVLGSQFLGASLVSSCIETNTTPSHTPPIQNPARTRPKQPLVKPYLVLILGLGVVWLGVVLGSMNHATCSHGGNLWDACVKYLAAIGRAPAPFLGSQSLPVLRALKYQDPQREQCRHLNNFKCHTPIVMYPNMILVVTEVVLKPTAST